MNSVRIISNWYSESTPPPPIKLCIFLSWLLLSSPDCFLPLKAPIILENLRTGFSCFSMLHNFCPILLSSDSFFFFKPLPVWDSPICACSAVTPWSVTHQALLSNFSRQSLWSGLPFLPPGIFPTQGSNPCLQCFLHWHADSVPLSHLSPLWTYPLPNL